MGAMTAPTLVGPRVTLRAFVADDRAARQRHGWHREIERGYGEDCLTRAMTDDEVRSWADYLAARTAAGASCWAVESDGELAGAAFLYDVREAGRKARLAIGMYAPQFLGRGLGTESVRLVLRHAFGTLGMHRVDLRVLDFNDRAIAAYRALRLRRGGAGAGELLGRGPLARRRHHGRARPGVRGRRRTESG